MWIPGTPAKSGDYFLVKTSEGDEIIISFDIQLGWITSNRTAVDIDSVVKHQYLGPTITENNHG